MDIKSSKIWAGGCWINGKFHRAQWKLSSIIVPSDWKGRWLHVCVCARVRVCGGGGVWIMDDLNKSPAYEVKLEVVSCDLGRIQYVNINIKTIAKYVFIYEVL